MEAVFDQLLRSIPDYTEFMTAREMDESSRRLARDYPDCVTLTDIGKTTGGNSLICLQIGDDPKKPNALFLGCPHPNEPIGAMMLEHLSLELAKSPRLRDALGYNCFLVKAWDYDGLLLNEGWLKGPFTIEHYARSMYRPASHLQVDWTFPLHHREYHFDAVMPETAAVMALIDRVRPRFIYTLHNSGFGGAYWYLSGAMPQDIYSSLYRAAEKQGIPLHLGEAEVPVAPKLAPAIFGMGDISLLYDYLYDNVGPEAANSLGMGTNSESYGRSLCGAFSLMAELPYFIDRRADDTGPSGYTRGECKSLRTRHAAKSDRAILDLLARGESYFSPDNLFVTTLRSFTGDPLEEEYSLQEGDEVPATRAERFSLVAEPMFYKLLSLGMLVRAFERELEEPPAAENAGALRALAEEAQALFEENSALLLDQLSYEPVAIPRLVALQLESGLAVARALGADCT